MAGTAAFCSRKVCFILDVGKQVWDWEWGGRLLSKAWLTPTDNQGARAFIGEGDGLHAETAQSALRVILKLFIGLTRVILIILNTVNLHFQDQFVPVSLKLILRIVCPCYGYSLSGRHVVNFLYLMGVSVSIRQLTGYGLEYYL